MSANYYTPIENGDQVEASVVNALFSTLDAQITAHAVSILAMQSEVADARKGNETLLDSIDAPIDTPVKSATPSGAGDTGTTGEMCWDTDYIYVCVATDTWKRVTLENWS